MKLVANNSIKISKRLTWAEYVASDYPSLECANFGYEHLMAKELKRWGKYDPQVFITDEDPKHNYGLSFKVYLRYTADGINFFRSISYGSSSLSNAGFRAISSLSFFQTEAEFDFMVDAMPYPTKVRWSGILA